jgi:hypothetical protein
MFIGGELSSENAWLAAKGMVFPTRGFVFGQDINRVASGKS